MPIAHMALNMYNQRHEWQPLSPSEDHVQEKCLFQLSSCGQRQSTSTADHGKQSGRLSLETSTRRRKYAAAKTAPAHRGSDTQGSERLPAPGHTPLSSLHRRLQKESEGAEGNFQKLRFSKKEE